MDALELYVDADLTRLTQAERLWLWRRRQKSANAVPRLSRQSITRRGARTMTRREASEQLGLTEDVYTQLEVGDAVLTEDQRRLLAGALEAMGPATIGEMCVVARRRSGGFGRPSRGGAAVTLAAVEAALGVSRPKAIEMERTGDPRLVRYWEARGFRFS